MQIRQLNLVNFRNYERMNITFSPSYNLIYGNNGMGKTNLIEAIYVLALTKSFRGTVDKVLIMNNCEWTKIEGTVKQLVDTNYQIVISSEGKKVKINNNKVVKLSEYISKINVILFNPDDLRIIKDTPSVRRKNLNIDISELNINYLKLLNTYNKTLKQRNMYLKTMNINANTDGDYLDILTDKLIKIGMVICNYRTKFINELNSFIEEIYKKITNEDGLKINYISNYSSLDEKQIKELYKKNRQRDIILGKTQIGIHHDDIVFLKNEKSLKDYGSEGQQKNAIISYKLAEIEIFKQHKKDCPILILDDLFSELDNTKINNLLSLLDNDIQTFITTTDISIVDKKILEKSKLIHIENGCIMEVL
ncbi:MAG: DNA replication/repair protein RecF [Bacilli bacterium]